MIQINGKRIDFSSQEIEYMRMEAGKPDHQSYASIAREMNIRYREHNAGKRTRQSVYEFMTADPNAPVAFRLGIDRSLVQEAREKGIDIQEEALKGLKRSLGKEVNCHSTSPVPVDDAVSVAGSSDSRPVSSTSTATGSKGRQKKSSIKATS